MDKIIESWKKILNSDYKPELKPEERHEFEKMALIEKQNKEKYFTLGGKL